MDHSLVSERLVRLGLVSIWKYGGNDKGKSSVFCKGNGSFS